MPDANTVKARSPAATNARLLSLDALRGLIMILMAIDHANYFIAKVHQGEFWGIALPHYEHILPFMTRWITHLCAPGFFFLMGSGMILFAASRRKAGWTETKVIRFFVVRGLLLIVLQLLVENPAWLLGPFGKDADMMVPPGGGGEVFLHFGVLYALGANMILFAFLLRAGTALIAFLSAGAILATQLFTPGASEAGVLYSPLLRLLLIPGHTGMWQSFYPLVPWMGLTGVGVIFGKLLPKYRQKLFGYILVIGGIFLILFLFIRSSSGFGNFHAGDDGVISFLNVTKYPPSLAFILLMLGLNFVLLFLFSKSDKALSRFGQPLLIFGRTALFFYIVHLYLYAVIGFAFPHGTSYGLMYLFWFLGLLILFPLCLWYGRFKREKPIESLWRLL